MTLKGIFFTGLLFSALVVGTHPSKAQGMEVSVLQYHPFGGISETGILYPGLGQGIRFGKIFKKRGYFIVGRVGCIFHWQIASEFLTTGFEHMLTGTLSTQWGMYLYRSKEGRAPLIYWVLHPQVGIAAVRDQKTSSDELGIYPDRTTVSWNYDYMGAFGFGPGFEIGSKYRGFMEAEMGPQVYFPNYYSIKAIYTTFSVGVRF